MQRTSLSREAYSAGETAESITICLNILQEAVNFVFSLPALGSGTFFIPKEDAHSYHRVIVAHYTALQVSRPYMVGFYGIRAPDPNGGITRDLVKIDDRLIEMLEAFGVGLYNTARVSGEYANTAVLPSKEASKKWAADNPLHQAAAQLLAPKCYSQVIKFTGAVDGWPQACRFDLDEVLLMKMVPDG